MKVLTVAASLFLICTLTISSVSAGNGFYEELGGEAGVEKIVDGFISEISYDQEIFPFFKNTDVPRLREKLIEQFCMVSGGPCEYTGDTMEDSHAGMNITTGEFNRVVELLQNAMVKADTPMTARNRLIRALAPLRPEIIER